MRKHMMSAQELDKNSLCFGAQETLELFFSHSIFLAGEYGING